MIMPRLIIMASLVYRSISVLNNGISMYYASNGRDYFPSSADISNSDIKT